MSILDSLRKKILQKKDTLHSLSFLTLNNIVTSVGALGTVYILANFLSQTDYGNYKYVFSIVGLVSGLSLSGSFRTAVVQSVSRGNDGTVTYLHSKNFRLNFFMLLGGCGTGLYYHFIGNSFLSFAIPIATISSIITNDAIIGSSYLNGRLAFKEIFYLQIFTSIVNIGALLSTILVTENLIFIILTVCGSSALTSYLYLRWIRMKWLRNTTIDEKILHYSNHLNFLGVLSAIRQNIDSVLIFHFLGAQSLALYAIATPAIDRMQGFLKSSYFLALSKFTGMGPQRSRLYLYERSFIALLLGFAIVIVYYFAAPYLYQFFFPNYIEAVPLSVLYSLTLPIIALGMLPNAYIDALIEIRYKYILQAVTFIIRIASLLMFLHWFGVAGVIWSELLTRTSTIITTVILIELHPEAILARSKQKLDTTIE